MYGGDRVKVDYSFYTDTYGGNRILEDDWKRLSLKAEQRLDSFTFGRCSGGWEGESWCSRAKCAVCEMTEILYADEKRDGKASENTDGYSVSYDTGESLGSTLYDVAQVYLGNTGLLYAGGD